METYKSDNSLKSSLSQLSLSNLLDEQDILKYATVPQCHADEIRPSILERYQVRKTITDTPIHYDNMIDYNSKSTMDNTESTKSSSKRSPKPLILRSFNWSIEPLWRYCASKMHLELEHKSESTVKDRKHQKNCNTKLSNGLRESPSVQVPLTSSQAAKSRLTNQDSEKSIMSSGSFSKDNLANDHHNNDVSRQCSLPAFEVLPPLFESCTHTLLYQNSYLLDGVKYDYQPNKNKNNQDQSVSTKLRLNYMKFLKSVNKSTKPSDRDIVFGNAKVIINPEPRWEGSRIDWLINLEKGQELRRLQHVENEQQRMRSEESNKMAKLSHFISHLKHSKKTTRTKNTQRENAKLHCKE